MGKSDNTKSLFNELADASVNSKTNPNKEFINSLTEAEKKQIIANATNIDTIEELAKLANNINENKVKKKNKGGHKRDSKIIPLSWLYIAASIVILFGVVLFINKYDTIFNDVETTIVDNNIETGTDKATLTLESGEEVTLVKGASFQTPNANSNGEKIVYKAGEHHADEIAFNYLTIPRGGQFNVTLADGTIVWLNSESQLKYPVNFIEGQPRQVELLYGEAYFDVSPSTDHKGAKFKVFHKSQEVEVLGTEFNIKAYKDETIIYTTLVEGKISLDTPENEKIILSPNDQANLNLNSNTIKTIPVDVYNEISWKKGIFSFKGKTLEEIMRVLSRWYDVDFVFENEELMNVQFNGVLGKDENITTLLKSIKTANFINAYEIKNKTITLN